MAQTEAVGLYEQWESEFKPLLGKSKRWEGFCYILKDQLSREQVVILETGSLRESGNWKLDGQSTRLWQWIRERKPGIAVSVDVDARAQHLTYQECHPVHAVCQDSVTFMRGFLPFAVTLLYLDSAECPWNTLAELASIYERLPTGCLIASDDAPTKATLISKVLPTPELDGYVTVWRKP